MYSNGNVSDHGETQVRLVNNEDEKGKELAQDLHSKCLYAASCSASHGGGTVLLDHGSIRLNSGHGHSLRL